MRPSVLELLLGWGTVGDIADGGVIDGVVMLSDWVGKGLLCLLPRERKNAALCWVCLKIGVRYEGVSLVGHTLEYFL